MRLYGMAAGACFVGIRISTHRFYSHAPVEQLVVRLVLANDKRGVVASPVYVMDLC
jgi:hypothetical protein